MFSILIRILLLVLGLYLLRRFLATLMGAPKPRPERDIHNPAKNMVKDPVCGMYLDTRLAIQVSNKEGMVYFCSEECRKKYANKERANAL
jgi:YHS domain-containing protein